MLHGISADGSFLIFLQVLLQPVYLLLFFYFETELLGIGLTFQEHLKLNRKSERNLESVARFAYFDKNQVEALPVHNRFHETKSNILFLNVCFFPYLSLYYLELSKGLWYTFYIPMVMRMQMH